MPVLGEGDGGGERRYLLGFPGVGGTAADQGTISSQPDPRYQLIPSLPQYPHLLRHGAELGLL